MSFEVIPANVKNFGSTPGFLNSINMHSAAYYATQGWLKRNSFMKLLRKYEILSQWNEPKQEYIEDGHFEGYWDPHIGKNGQQFIPRVTPSGLELIKTIIPEHELVPFEIIDNE